MFENDLQVIEEICKTNIRSIQAASSENYVLASSGDSISILEKINGQFRQVKTFKLSLWETIIGIRLLNDECDNDNICFVAFSTRQLLECRLALQQNNWIKEEKRKIFVNYWTIDLIFEKERFIILNAKNQVVIYERSSGNLLLKFEGIDKCILYSGKLFPISDEHILVLSGTVFTKAIVWSIIFSKLESTVHHYLEGHDGVIFAIEYYPPLNLIITASDDRSIRIWKQPTPIETLPPSTSYLNLQAPFICDHIYYGHSSRIWKILITHSNSHPILLSAGEDSSLHSWSLTAPYLSITKQTFFPNNRIWTIGYCCNTILLGGSDGALKTLELPNLLSTGGYTPEYSRFQVQHPKAVSFMNQKICSLLTVSDNGKIKFHNENDSIPIDWKTRFENIFGDYCAMDVNDLRTHWIMASKDGHVTLIVPSENYFGPLLKLFEENVKIFNISFVTNYSFLVSLSNGRLFLYNINCEQNIIPHETEFELPKSKHQWSSCAVLVYNLLVVGDCNGSLFGFYTDQKGPEYEFVNVHGVKGTTVVKHQPGSRYIYSGGRNGRVYEYLITFTSRPNLPPFQTVCSFQILRTFAIFPDMQWIAGLSFMNGKLCFVYGFGSRDFMLWDVNQWRTVFDEECGGGHRFWDFVLDFDRSQFMFCYTNKETLSLVRRCMMIESTPDTLSYSSLPRKINCCSRLTFNKHMKNDDRTASQKEYPGPSDGVTAQKTISEEDAAEQYNLFVLGGENNFMQIVECHSKTLQLKPVKTLNGHISNISGVKILSLSSQQSLLISCGGRGQLMVWTITDARYSSSDSFHLICDERLSNFLGIEDELLDFTGKNQTSKKTVPDVDVRYMDVDAQQKSETQFILLLACSDCSFRLFIYDDAQRKIVNSRKFSNGNSCALLSRFVPFVMSNSSTVLAAIASNSGIINFWNVSDAFNSDSEVRSPIGQQQQHLGGINAIDFYKIHRSKFLLGTGGDDNAIKINLITISESYVEGECTIRANFVQTFSDHTMHSCLISGLIFIDQNRFVTSSIDQKIVLWRIDSIESCDNSHDDCHTIHNDDEGDGNGNQLEQVLFPINFYLSSIADISSLERIDSKTFLICGEGFQIIRCA